MALTKETIVDKIEVREDGRLQVRTAIRIKEDGVELSSSFSRHVVVPSTKNESDAWVDTDISGEDARVQAIATATWTAEVKTAYQEMIDAL
jgi:hypothetical protein